MRNGALIGALVLGLLGVSLNVNAYHIAASNLAGTPSTQGTWNLAPPPVVIVVVAGVVVVVIDHPCESNNFLGAGVPKEGNGGLCFMSPGCDPAAAGPPASNGNIRSNGDLPDEVDGVAAVCGTAALIDVPFSSFAPTNYVDIDVDEGLPATAAEVGWTANIIDFCNIVPGSKFRYSEQYAYWANDGHVMSFIDVATTSGPAATGSYAVDDTGVPAATGCDNDPSNGPPSSAEPTEDFIGDIDY